MKPVQSTLKKWMDRNDNFQENYNRIKNEVLSDPEIKDFLSLYPELPQRDIEKNLIKLYEYKSQSKQCEHCASLGGCKNMIKGYSPILRVEDNEIHLSYEKCHSRIVYEKEQEQKNLIQSLYMPKEILEATIDGIDDDPHRSKAIREIITFIGQVKNGLPQKGLYLYGPFGVGKTYFLGAIANELKKYNISSMLIYMPEFVREIKSSIKDDSINEKIDYFKKADVLMLDDIGAETQSAWFRDEVLGTILQYRMMERLPVFFTSNYSMDQLEEHLAKTNRGDIEAVKAGRIMERIKQVSKEVPIFASNRREQ
ncbi:primosomal protein DnaI [Ornithinibacillus sp. BX22]|uniref:Primosomal protein DnaI n=2 Tax=Ornithinibacillus TaxID=484508 RepID=A0A923L6Y0_9BACI|nr:MULTISPECIES: primosomal protein DnaI [Ornithinibacillus]MBC5637495.1 primosomal protein DnaI [Ornithinibacillus hominis]MBS3682063.1 primosomal protein DnaI [Ornithinibacillus massiliensis]